MSDKMEPIEAARLAVALKITGNSVLELRHTNGITDTLAVNHIVGETRAFMDRIPEKYLADYQEIANDFQKRCFDLSEEVMRKEFNFQE